MWLSLNKKNILIDPGPGSLIRIFENKLEPEDIDIFVLSHRHLDHVSDINAVIESATKSHKKKKDLLIAPNDTVYGDDPVVLKYSLKGIKKVETIEENKEIIYEGIKIKPLIKHIHNNVENYSLGFFTDNKTVIYVPCGKFYEEMLYAYPENPDLMIFNTTFVKPVADINHLSVKDVEKIIEKSKPKKTILTHFSVMMLKYNPEKIAKELSEKLKLEVIAAKDGMKIFF